MRKEITDITFKLKRIAEFPQEIKGIINTGEKVLALGEDMQTLYYFFDPERYIRLPREIKKNPYRIKNRFVLFSEDMEEIYDPNDGKRILTLKNRYRSIKNINNRVFGLKHDLSSVYEIKFKEEKLIFNKPGVLPEKNWLCKIGKNIFIIDQKGENLYDIDDNKKKISLEETISIEILRVDDYSLVFSHDKKNIYNLKKDGVELINSFGEKLEMKIYKLENLLIIPNEEFTRFYDLKTGRLIKEFSEIMRDRIINVYDFLFYFDEEYSKLYQFDTDELFSDFKESVMNAWYNIHELIVLKTWDDKKLYEITSGRRLLRSRRPFREIYYIKDRVFLQDKNGRVFYEIKK